MFTSEQKDGVKALQSSVGAQLPHQARSARGRDPWEDSP